MDHGQLAVVSRIAVALLIGGIIGLERTFHGRPAGFRTHSLVSVASALLMLVTVYQSDWMTATPLEAIRTDPTRIAQGIMTGIGFLGAGVIFKEGLTVRGLTTAASIWITAAIGIMIGAGFYFPAFAATLGTLSVLSGFRWIEGHLPAEFYAHLWVTFTRGEALSEGDVRRLTQKHHFIVSKLSQRLTDQGANLEYRMVIRTTKRKRTESLAGELRGRSDVLEFRINPMGD